MKFWKCLLEKSFRNGGRRKPRPAGAVRKCRWRSEVFGMLAIVEAKRIWSSSRLGRLKPKLARPSKKEVARLIIFFIFRLNTWPPRRARPSNLHSFIVRTLVGTKYRTNKDYWRGSPLWMPYYTSSTSRYIYRRDILHFSIHSIYCMYRLWLIEWRHVPHLV